MAESSSERRHGARLLTPTGAMRAWPAVIMTALGMGIALALMFAYVQKVAADSDRRDIQRQREICGLVRLYQPDDPALAAELKRYADAIGCPP